MAKKANIFTMDIEQLACFILEIDEDSDYSEIDEALYEKFECTFESFHEIVSYLLPLCDVGESPLTNKVYRGFSDREKQCWIIKTEN